MKSLRSILYLIVIFTSVNSVAAQEVKLTGDLEGTEDKKFTIHFLKDGERVTDTIQPVEGKFTWSTTMTEPQKVYLMFEKRYFDFFADQGNIFLKGDVENYDSFKVTGSSIQDEAEAYSESISDITEQRNQAYQELHSASEEEKMAIEKKIENIGALRDQEAKKYIAANPGSFFSLSLVSDKTVVGGYEDVVSFYELLDPGVLKTNEGQKLRNRLEVLKRSRIGATIPDFVQNDVEGNSVNLSDYKGKYLFIDFWASWCGPCRAENPNLLKAYNTYKDENFTVLGISIDDNKDRWVEAITEDKLPWVQISDLKGIENEISSYFGIQAIPQTFLVNPEGKIIAKNLRGAMLHEKLAEILGN